MNLPRRLGIVFMIALFFTSCGGGISSSGSGIGGTGITLVQGNISSVDGQFLATIRSDDSQHTVAYYTQWIVPLSYAQSSSSGSLTVSGGGRSSSVNASGEFELAGVTPSANFVLTFEVSGNDSISLGIGEVLKGATVTVKNIKIDTTDSSARPAEVEVEAPVVTEDDISEDVEDSPENENETEDEEDDNSTDDEDEEDEEDEEDDNSYDDEDEEDEEDDNSYDDEK